MIMAQSLDMDDWLVLHAPAAHAQGWCLCETGQMGQSGIEVKSTCDWETDARAVEHFRTSFMRQEDHAVSAYLILHRFSISEFMHWNMSSWRENNT